MTKPLDPNNPGLRDAVKFRAAREQLFAGNPEPMLELQWPGVLFDDFQLDIVRSFFHGGIREIFIKGCTGAGKGCAVAVATNLWFTLNADCKILLCASDLGHAERGIFAEVVSWRQKMRFPGPGSIRKTGIGCHAQKFLKLVNPDSEEGMSGHHGPAQLFVFDEATAIPQRFYDLALNQAHLIVALANPRDATGWFRWAFPKIDTDVTQTIQSLLGPRRCITIAGHDCRNVREKREVIPNQLTYERYQAMLSHHDQLYVDTFALAKFPAEDRERQLILPSWLGRHVNAWHDKLPVTHFGLDVAASATGDLTVLAAGGIHGVRALHTLSSNNTMAVVDWVLEVAKQYYAIDLKKTGGITVDENGLGKGVADRLAEMRVQVRPFSGGAAAKDSDRYRNRRVEAYGNLALQLDPDGPTGNKTWALPDDRLLREELVAPEKEYQGEGFRFGLTPKTRRGRSNFEGATIHEKLGRSPDRADAVSYLHDGVHELGDGRWKFLPAGTWLILNGPIPPNYNKEERQAYLDDPNVPDFEKAFGKPPEQLTEHQLMWKRINRKLDELEWRNDNGFRW